MKQVDCGLISVVLAVQSRKTFCRSGWKWPGSCKNHQFLVICPVKHIWQVLLVRPVYLDFTSALITSSHHAAVVRRLMKGCESRISRKIKPAENYVKLTKLLLIRGWLSESMANESGSERQRGICGRHYFLCKRA